MEKSKIDKQSRKQLDSKETIRLLLYLCEDLKMKVFHGEKFGLYQLPTINSIIKAIEEQEMTVPLNNAEFSDIIITKNKLLWNN